MRRTVGAGLVLAFALTAGCAAKKPLSADQYFSQAQRYFRSGAYPLAIDNYRELLDQHPFSDYTEEAELRIAHAHYLDGEYIEAIAALTDFQRRHPTSPSLPFVGYLLGKCYELQMGTTDRDQSAAQSAEAYFATVLQQYPQSPFAELARGQLEDCQESLAAKELYVAKFYNRHGNDVAAERRMLEVVGRYPKTPQAGDALFRLGRIYERRNDVDLAKLAYAALVEEHPSNSNAAAAHRALARMEDDGSVPASAPRASLLARSGFDSLPARGVEAVQVPGLEKDDRAPLATLPPLGVPVGGAGSY